MIKPAKSLLACLLLLPSALPGKESTAGTQMLVAERLTSNNSLDHLNPRHTYTLPPLVPAEIESLVPQEPSQARRLQIGARRAIQPALIISPRNVSAWTLLPDGSHAWSGALASQGGLGIRVHLENLSLPAGARILVYNPDNPGTQPFAVNSQDLANQRDVWTQTVFGDHVLITFQVPAGVDAGTASLEVTEISHIFALPTTSNLKEGTCHNDVSCYGDWSNDAAAVARISFVEHGNTFLCTGCLLAATVQTSAEYFLTASHCIPNQTVASTIEFFWLYQTSSCGGPPPALSDVPQTSGGADRLAGSTTSDFAFLRLKRAAPGGVSFLAWSQDAPAQGETLTCIHHPDGSFARISFGNLYDSDADFWAVQWFSGVTEGGSSGSPLLNANHQVVGQLNGGFEGPGSSCDDPSAPDQFGRFDVAFASIKRWLTPASGGTGGGTDFTAIKGAYNGLFIDSSSADPQHTSGLATIAVASNGKLTGKLTLGAQRISMIGQFDAAGKAQININRRGSAPLTVNLQADLSGGSDQIIGSVSDGNFNAALTANLNLFTAANPSPQTGQYTIVLPGSADGGNAPDGAGYATVTVDRSGRVKLGGSLADGTKLSQSSFVSRDGAWPLYIPLYAGGGSVLSWINFSGSDSLAGDVTWIRPGQSVAKYYPGGFSVQLAATGSRYTRPAAGGAILDLTNAQLVLSGGDLSQDVSDAFQLDSRNRVVNLGPGKLTLSFSTSNGSFSGKLSDPSTATKTTFRGVVLQDRNFGTGYFLGPNHSGQVLMGP